MCFGIGGEIVAGYQNYFPCILRVVYVSTLFLPSQNLGVSWESFG
jgi:hypothetical protein